jgi:hypothetical protein
MAKTTSKSIVIKLNAQSSSKLREFKSITVRGLNSRSRFGKRKSIAYCVFTSEEIEKHFPQPGKRRKKKRQYEPERKFTDAKLVK